MSGTHPVHSSLGFPRRYLGLCACLGEEEIKDTTFSMDADSAPGPDGFSAKFYFACWEVVGKDVIAAVKALFGGALLDHSWTTTFLDLIPKSEQP